jgi:hypothetical protein
MQSLPSFGNMLLLEDFTFAIAPGIHEGDRLFAIWRWSGTIFPYKIKQPCYNEGIKNRQPSKAINTDGLLSLLLSSSLIPKGTPP